MNEINFHDFYGMFSVKRNPIQSCASYENTMLDFDDEETEIIEEEDSNKVWTLVEGKDGKFILNPGIMYTNNVMGFFICKEKWSKNQESYILQ